MRRPHVSGVVRQRVGQAGLVLIAVGFLVALGLLAVAPARTGATATPRPTSSPATAIPGRFLIGAAANTSGQFTTATGITPDVIEHYVHFGSPFDMSFAWPSVPLVQLMPTRHLTPAEIAAGQADPWLKAYAADTASYRYPVIFGFAPEMNGSWYPWGWTHATPADYIAAWRHVVTIFRQAGASNVRWIWTVNVNNLGPQDPSSQVTSIESWWPGASWVTWIGVDGYDYLPTQGFTSIFGITLAEIHTLTTTKPVLVAETAIAPQAGQAAKIPGLFAGAHQAGVRGLVWFDLPGNRAWPITSPAAVNAYRAAAGERAPIRG